MTDEEQIMINGVDVSECEYLTYQLEEDGQYYWFCNIAPAGGPDECEYNSECSYKKMFKQLARKTQECEDLRETLKKEVIYKRTYLKSLLDCKEECEALKSESFTRESLITEQENEIDELRQECEKLKEKFKKFFNIDNQECWDIAFLKDENARYCKALDEISKIVVQDRNIKDVCLISTCPDAGRVAYDIQQQIIDIINNVKERSD